MLAIKLPEEIENRLEKAGKRWALDQIELKQKKETHART